MRRLLAGISLSVLSALSILSALACPSLTTAGASDGLLIRKKDQSPASARPLLKAKTRRLSTHNVSPKFQTTGGLQMVFRVLLVAWTMLFMAVSAGFAEAEVKKIEDNSFLIEEAYNQEDGVIQHIQSFQYNLRSKEWAYVFVQEFPVPGRTHQLSYNIPAYRLTDEGSGTGLGDVQLNYRYQLIDKEDFVAMAPRLSLLLPTGDYRKGLGRGAVGFQTNLPLSLTLSDKWVTHWNAGMTVTPNARGQEGGKVHAVDFNAGASVIYVLHENFNFMLETAYNAVNTVDGNNGHPQLEHSLFINPGARFAINFKSGLQIVPGISFPIGIGPSRGEYGVFFYLSLEHPFPFLYGKPKSF